MKISNKPLIYVQTLAANIIKILSWKDKILNKYSDSITESKSNITSQSKNPSDQVEIRSNPSQRTCAASIKQKNFSVWAETFSPLLDELFDRKLIGNCCDNWFIVEIFVQAKVLNIHWLQPFKCEDLLVFFDIFDRKLYIFGFWTSSWKTKHIYMCHLWLWKNSNANVWLFSDILIANKNFKDQ